MKSIKILFLLLFTMSLYGQESCGKLKIHNEENPELKIGNHIFIYLKKKYPALTKHISNRKSLIEIPTSYNKDSSVIFYYNDIQINIGFTLSNIDVNPYFSNKELDEKYRSIKNLHGAPFGICSEDSIIKTIKSLTINEKEIEASVFNLLLRPNQFNTISAIQPIKAFISPCKKYIYLYIWGEPCDYLEDFSDAFQFSYLAKLIFNYDGTYIDKIVEEGRILSRYEFITCPDYYGF